MKFYVGMHHPANVARVPRAFVSVNVLVGRKSDLRANEWIMDSGAFTQIAAHGKFTLSVREYADQIERWRSCGTPGMRRAVSQDWMCEPFMVERTGLSVREHQRLTVDRYAHLRDLCGDIVMPVIQGFHPDEYAQHVEDYARADFFSPGMWVGVGSVCKRQGNPSAIVEVLRAVRSVRPDLRLHGFGVKTSSLAVADVRDELYSADSMAWSYAERKRGGNANDWRAALRFFNRIDGQAVQEALF